MKPLVRPSRLRSLFVGLLAVSSLSLSSTRAQTAAQQGNAAANLQFPGRARGNAAIKMMGSHLPEVALLNGIEAHALEALLRRERDLWVDAHGHLFYVCEGLAVPQGALTASDTVADSSTAVTTTTSDTGTTISTDAFKLHSLPGASRVIYLDLNGHTTSGTAWNSNFTGGADIVSAPFDMDGDPTSWSAAELDRIKKIWQRVAEDFMPFAVDVTTEDPGVEALRRTSSSDNAYGIRVVISPTSAWYPGAGGTAYVGSFNASTDLPCFIFPDRLGPNNEKCVADAISHEVGHTLGLNHKGTTSGTEYYMGQGNWAPIMGVGYYRAITQWSKGEYALANNTADEVAVMQTYGAPLSLDDHGDTLAAATDISGPSVFALGVIESRTDVDLFRFTTGAGNISLALSGTSSQPNLDISAELLDENGTVLMTSNPTGLTASIAATLPAGTYYLRVRGVGAGDPVVDGYSNYDSMGEYQITGTLVASTTVTLQAPQAAASGTPTSGTVPLTVAFSSAGSSDADGSIVSYAWNFGNGTTSTAANPSCVYTTEGTFYAVLTVTDNDGLTNTATVVITVGPAANVAPTAVAGVSASSGTAPVTVTFSSQGSTDTDGSITSYYWTFGDGTTSTAANPTKTYTTAGQYTAVLTVMDNQGATGSAQVTVTVNSAPAVGLDVYSLAMSQTSTKAGKAAVSTIRILDAQSRPVAGATVAVSWSGVVTGTGLATTDANGTVVFTSKLVKKSGVATVTITGVTPPYGYSLNSTLFSAPMTGSVTL